MTQYKVSGFLYLGIQNLNIFVCKKQYLKKINNNKIIKKYVTIKNFYMYKKNKYKN